MFKYFDIDLTGRLDYNQFFAAMTRLNFVGVQVFLLRSGFDGIGSPAVVGVSFLEIVPSQYVSLSPRKLAASSGGLD